MTQFPNISQKETSRRIQNEEKTYMMQIDKVILIHNTVNDPLTMASMGTTISQAIEYTTQTMSL